MTKLKILYPIVSSLFFFLLGIYLIRTTETTFGKIIGIACIVLFGGMLLFTIFKLIRKKE